ncbi:hypothetical protein ACFU6I_11665 [Streptomyces sp. NPDC057486]|uniref:hypothetical protein n=1 Tax=Streptomyces sp. NPDC057486 TaxID=3346145 RepID=UPI0036C2B155
MIKPQIRPARLSDIDAVAQLLARKWDITASTVTRWLDTNRGDEPGTDKTVLMSIDLPRPTASVAIA